jgi:hypothetical protein
MWPLPAAQPWGPSAFAHGVPAGYCRQCGQPSGSCCCGCRECRKEAKELLVTPQQNVGGDNQGLISKTPIGAMTFAFLSSTSAAAPPAAQLGVGEAFIGGGCCVSLSVEYTPSSPTVQATVAILVSDSEGTTMAWLRVEQPGTGYHVKECVITTKPGAKLAVLVINATARVRWCEIFSC